MIALNFSFDLSALVHLGLVYMAQQKISAASEHHGFLTQGGSNKSRIGLTSLNRLKWCSCLLLFVKQAIRNLI
jgi:hypothetical protein